MYGRLSSSELSAVEPGASRMTFTCGLLMPVVKTVGSPRASVLATSSRFGRRGTLYELKGGVEIALARRGSSP